MTQGHDVVKVLTNASTYLLYSRRDEKERFTLGMSPA